MKVFIPTKLQIEGKLERLRSKVKRADKISDIEEYLIDELSQLDCDVENRASVERGIITEK